MKIIRYDNPTVTLTVTTASSAVEYNSTELIVVDASGFSTDDILLLEEQGHEKNEIVYISSILGNTITLSVATTLPHLTGITVTKLNYDKFKISKSNDDSTYSDVVTSLLKYNNKYNQIEYTDNALTASDNLYYKVYYVNSKTSTETLQTTLFENNNSSYISIDEYRAETGFTSSEVTDAEISIALKHGVEWIQDNAYNNINLRTSLQDTIFELDLGNMVFTDWNADGIIDKNDIEIFELHNETNMRTYVSHLVVKIFEDTSKILFSETLPRANKELVINAKVAFKSTDEIKQTRKTINKMIATNWLLMNLDVNKIKGGVTSWTAGGTNVNRDMSNIKESIDKNYLEAKRLLSQMLKTYMKKTKLRNKNSMYNNKSRSTYGLRLPSGNVVMR